jgi:hypothetical protein
VIVNLHRTNTRNIGDLMCAPYRYFDFLKSSPVYDLIGFKPGEAENLDKRKEWVSSVQNADGLVIGGGGLIANDFFTAGFQRITAEKKSDCKTVIWGAGHNQWEIRDWRKLKYEIDPATLDYDLVGIRDYNQGHRWVPCVTCMDLAFDGLSGSTTTREVGLFLHSATMNNPELKKRVPSDIEHINNDADFNTVINFLSSCETVLTDSFHGMYWSTLLGRKVIAFPSSSKFYSMKHPAPLCAPEDWQIHRRMATTYSEALYECRQANSEFATDVRSLLNV